MNARQIAVLILGVFCILTVAALIYLATAAEQYGAVALLLLVNLAFGILLGRALEDLR
jgi:uncharacterized protein involved in exopolysaccharide biosynthesis